MAAEDLTFYRALYARIDELPSRRLRLHLHPARTSKAALPAGYEKATIRIDASIGGSGATIDEAAREFARRAAGAHMDANVRQAMRDLCGKWGVKVG